jgi:hypothetical protein
MHTASSLPDEGSSGLPLHGLYEAGLRTRAVATVCTRADESEDGLINHSMAGLTF